MEKQSSVHRSVRLRNGRGIQVKEQGLGQGLKVGGCSLSYWIQVPLILPVVWFLGLIGFDTPDVVWGTLHELVHQHIGLGL